MSKQQSLITSIDDDQEEGEKVVSEPTQPLPTTALKRTADVDPPWAKAQAALPAVIEDPIFRLAEKGVSMEQLEKLIAMRDRERAYQAKSAFDQHFAEMQQAFSELGPAPKSKDVDGKYKYAPLNTLVKHYGSTIARFGFSFRFYEAEVDNGRLQVSVDISGYGHTVTNSKVMPVYEPDKIGQSGKSIMNVLQAEGVRSTYGQRYVFNAGFGLVSEYEDTDGMGFQDGVKYADWINPLQTENDLEALRALAKTSYDELKAQKDHDGASLIRTVYERRKADLERKGAGDAGV